MRQIVWLASMALAVASSLGQAQETAGNRWPITDVAAPTTELALELYVTLSPRVEVGESDDGVRQFIPITGGRFSGAKAFAARSCRAARIGNRAGATAWSRSTRSIPLRTDDGAVIVVDNRGIIVPPPPAAAGGAAAPAAGYVRTSPRFHAPQGKYDWLNKTVFIGTITPATGGGAVIIRAFRVR